MKAILDQTRFVRTGTQGPLSESIIPAVPGKYYAYSSFFTDEAPLYAMMDCKANKSREIAHAGDLGREVHLMFEFNNSTLGGISSIKSAQAAGSLGHVDVEFDDVWIAPAHIAIEDFYTICAQRDSAKLAIVCRDTCQGRLTSCAVAPGIIVAVMTNAGKYGIFLVKELTPKMINIDACHVMLP